MNGKAKKSEEANPAPDWAVETVKRLHLDGINMGRPVMSPHAMEFAAKVLEDSMRPPSGEIDPAVMFCRNVLAECDRARRSFPSSELSFAALTEEVGELAKALLDEPAHRIRSEAVQVAVMALRVATEGDGTFEKIRSSRMLDSSIPVSS